MNNPFGVATDASGNVYIVDQFNDRIRKVNAAGIISTIAGNGTAGAAGDGGAAIAAQIDTPAAVALDNAGNIYIADLYNSKVRKVNSAGMISTFAGESTWGYSGDGMAATASELYCPDGLAADSLGNIYIADGDEQRIRKVGTCVGTSGTPTLHLAIDILDIEVYPNPNNGHFSILLPSRFSEAKITLCDLAGRVLKTETTYETESTFVISGYAPGLYLLNLDCGGTKYVKKVVLE